MAKSQVSADQILPGPATLEFDDVKVCFSYVFYLQGWSEIQTRLSESHICVETEGKNRKHKTLKWIADKIAASSSFNGIQTFAAEPQGTRPYLGRLDPFLRFSFSTQELYPKNWDFIPGLKKTLSGQTIKITPSVRLYSSGFGVLRLSARFLTDSGRESAIAEIIKAANQNVKNPLRWNQAESLSENIRGLFAERNYTIPDHESVVCLLPKIEHSELRQGICERFNNLIEHENALTLSLTPETVVEIGNLDRGIARNLMPKFKWRESPKEEEPLYGFFSFVINDLLCKSLAELKDHVGFDLPKLSLYDHWYADNGQYPYVSFYIPWHAPWCIWQNKLDSFNELADQFRSHINVNSANIARILLRTYWTRVREEWEPISAALKNLFYSDLLHINIHLRSTLCYFFQPTSLSDYERFPELENSYKYREELANIVESQRLLWYAYNLSDHFLNEEIEAYSAKFDNLMDSVKTEEYEKVVDGLRSLIEGIDRRKTELVQIMIDPQSRKDSSLFTEICTRTTEYFHLAELYKNIQAKQERLDMLGLHVSQALNQCSNLQVAEGARSAQLTLEVLEALILGFYAVEMIELTTKIYKEANDVNISPFPLDVWWMFHVLGAAAFFAALPWITKIRSTFGNFETREPSWFETISKFGSVAGPVTLSSILISSLIINEKNGRIFLRSPIPIMNKIAVFLIILVCAAVILAWWRLENRSKQHDVHIPRTRMKNLHLG